MSQSRPKLSNLRRACPQDLAHCEGYVWHLGTKIGKGSFGEVYLGWTNDGKTEVAVKVVRKEFFKQDPKVRENLEREIRILKLLRGCEYVVQLFHVQDLRHCIVLVMELCDYDLDHLVKVEPFKEETIIVFLFQLAQGMKALRNQNIVHRDLKPGNILIHRHPTTKKMMIKLADFGFARHFKDEGNKAIDMTSLAGTPVFMAPEALSCVFHPGEHYDDKVDIWSIGALLYKVIVGQCGFYAQLQDIPRILKHKGDAIAFERAPNRKVNYIYELPSSVNDRLSESFRDGMKNLLCSMLKLDPRERMTFTEFFENVDDIIRSKIEVINLLHGTSFKIIADPTLTADVLIDKVHIQWHIPSVSQVIFSTSCSHYISPHENISQTQLVELLNKSGGSEGHAKLFLLPLNQLQQTNVLPDSTCFTALKYTVDDEASIVDLITEQKFSDEIVHMIGYMGAQQKKQLEGLEELAQFTTREIGTFKANIYPLLLEEIHQTLAKASLAFDWLSDDVANLDGPVQSQLVPFIASLEQNKSQLQDNLQELAGFNTDCPKLATSSIKDEISKSIAALSERAKKLPKARKDQIQAACIDICKDSIVEISRVTQVVKTHLVPFSDVLTRVWSLRKKSSDIFKTCSMVNHTLFQALQERSTMLKSLSAGTSTQDKKTQAAPANHVPVVPPPAWPHPSAGVSWTDPALIDNFKRQIDQLNSQLANASEENVKLKAEVISLQPGFDSTHDVESTLIPSQVAKTSNSDTVQRSGVDTKVMENLAQKLQQFCVLAEKMNEAVPSPKAKPAAQALGGGALYPNLLADYSVISMPSLEDCDMKKLLPMAVELSTTLSNNMSSLEKTLHKSNKEIPTLTPESALVKIGRPSEYERGDIVLFTAVKTVKSRSNIPALLHLQQVKPYVLLDASSYGSFNIRPGKTPELFFGKLLEAPRKMKFEDHKDTASEVGEEIGEFYYVTAERVPLKFSAQRTGGTLDSQRPARSPTVSPSGANKFWAKPFHRSHGNKPDKDFV